MGRERYGDDVEGYREAVVEALESLEPEDPEDGGGSTVGDGTEE